MDQIHLYLKEKKNQLLPPNTEISLIINPSTHEPNFRDTLGRPTSCDQIISFKTGDKIREIEAIVPKVKSTECLKPSIAAGKLSKAWFSHQENVFLIDKGKFSWAEQKKIWDWDNLSSIDIMGTESGHPRFVIRRNRSIYSGFRRKEIELRFMLDFEAQLVRPPRLEAGYTANKYIANDPQPRHQVGPKERYAIQIDEDRWIWQHIDDQEQDFSAINEIYREIQQTYQGFSLLELEARSIGLVSKSLPRRKIKINL